MQESRISNEMVGLRDSNEMLLAKTSALEAENADMLRAVDLMREEIENIESNERNLITKLKDLDQENQQLMTQSGSLTTSVVSSRISPRFGNSIKPCCSQ